MAGLCWMAVTLAFFLSAQHSMAAVDPQRLSEIVDGVLGLYGTEGMFSLAVRIPGNQDIQNILQTLSESDPAGNVENYYANDGVYKGKRLVAAKVLKKQSGGAEDAESRVVTHLQRLWDIHQKEKKKNPNEVESEMLLFYVRSSPCVEKCTNRNHPETILEKIQKAKKWQNYAFVFSLVFRPSSGKPNTPEELRGALERLEGAVGWGSVYRCDKTRGGQRLCRSCSAGGEVAEYCYSTKANFFNTDGGATAPGTSIQPQPGSSYSPSRGRSPSRRPSRSPSRSPSRRSSVSSSGGVSTSVDSDAGGSQGGRRRRNRRKNKQKTNTGDSVSSSRSGRKISDSSTGSYTGGSQGGSRGGRRRRRRNRRKNKQKPNTGDNVALS